MTEKKFYTKTYPGQIIVFLFNLLTAIAPLAIPILYKQCIDQGIGNKNINIFLKTSMLLLLLHLASNILKYVAFMVQIHYLTKNYMFLNDFFFTCFLKSREDILNKKTAGDFQTILNNDILNILPYLTDTFPMVLSRICFAGGALYFIFDFNVKLAMITLFVTALMLGISLKYLKDNDLAGEGMRDAYLEKSDFLIGTYDYSHYIKINRLIDLFKKLYLKINSTFFGFFYNASKNEEKSREINDFLSSMIQILILVIVGKEIFEGRNSIGTLIALQVMVPNFYGPILSALNTLTGMGRNKECFLRLVEFSKYEQEKDHGVDCDTIADIQIMNLNFNYDGNSHPKVLYNDLTSKIQIGKINVIKGSNGSGKSTLLKIITGCYEPSAGHIIINGQDIRDINLYDYRDKLHYCPQVPFIIKGTILNNILIKDSSERSEILNKLTTAGLQDYIKSIGGLDRMIHSSKDLSGGEKQFIELARMLISNAPVIILDEPQSAMDNKMKDIFMDQIVRINKDMSKTFIIISHNELSIPDIHKIIIK